MNVLGIIASAVAALFITAVLAKGARRAALRPHAPDAVRERAPRAGARPGAGGTAVVLGAGGAACGALWLGAAGGAAGSVAGLLAGAGAVAALGLVHDTRPLPAVLRLAAQTAAAALVVCLAGFPAAAGVPAVLGIVLVTNAFLLLDHADGVLTAVGAVTAAGLVACAAGDPAPALLPATLAAALAVFLLHSRPPAWLRLGACGAQFTGFALAASGALIQADAPSGAGAWTALPVLAAVALADAAVVLVSRRRAARPLFCDADDHIAHRLRRLRVTVPGTVVLPALWAAVSVGVGALVHTAVLHPLFLLLPAAGTVAAVLALLRVPAYAPPRTGAHRAPAPAAGAAPPSPPSAPAGRSPAPTAAARTPEGRPTVPPPPSGRSAAGVAAERG